MSRRKTSQLCRVSLCLLLAVVYWLFPGGVVSAIARSDLNAIIGNTVFYDPDNGGACNSDASNPAANGSQPKVYILGDSIIDWFANASDAKGAEYGVTPGLLKTALSDKGVEATIQAKGGRQLKGSHYSVTPDGLGQIEADQAAIKESSSAIIALGTNRNDPWDSDSKESFRNDVTAAVKRLKELNSSIKISWVNVAYTGETLTTDPPGSYAYATSFSDYNQVLGELSASEGFTIIDWKAKVDADPVLIGTNYGALDGYAHVHPSPDGAKVYANMLADSVTSSSTAATQAANGNIYMLGDSITVRGAAKYKEILEAQGKKLTISAVVGRSWTSEGQANGEGWQVGTTGKGKDALEADKDIIKEAGTVVIALGSNGFSGGNPIDEIAASVKAINPTAQILWVNVASGPADNDDVIGFNTALNEKAAAQGFKVVDWAKIVDPTGNGTHNSAGHLEGDDLAGIHPKIPSGVDALVKLVTEEIGLSGGTSTTSQPSGSNLGCKCDASQNGMSGSVVLTGGDHVEKAYNFFIGKGLGAVQAAAIVGNFMMESGVTLDLTISNSLGTYGIAQWLYGRKTALLARPDHDTLEGQLAFSWEELNGPYKKSTLDPMNATQDLTEAVYIFEAHYEVAGAIPWVMAKRVEFAQSVLDTYGSNSGSGSGPSTTSACNQKSGTNGTSMSASCDTSTSLPIPGDAETVWFNGHNHGHSVSFNPYEGKHGTIINPIKGTHYGNEAIKNSAFSYGEAVDVGLAAGTKVYTPTDGKVLRSTLIHPPGGSDGYFVVVESSNKRCVSLMAHLDAPLVNEGDVVSAGQDIGTIKDMGFGSHLHFELWVNGEPVNIGEDPDPCTYKSGCSDRFDDEAGQIWDKQKQILMGQ